MINKLTEIASGIRNARAITRLSQSELARRSGLTQAAISYYESGKRTPGSAELIALSKALHVSVEALCGCDYRDTDVDAAIAQLRQVILDRELGVTQIREISRYIWDSFEGHDLGLDGRTCEVIRDRYRAGESVEELAEDYELSWDVVLKLVEEWQT
ncbi:MAG: helix-turn-helix transcriptional regulator [Cyanobacteria bacterium J06648_11]